MILNDDIEFAGYWPEHDEEFDIKRMDTRIFNYEEVFQMYLATLRNMQ